MATDGHGCERTWADVRGDDRADTLVRAATPDALRLGAVE